MSIKGIPTNTIHFYLKRNHSLFQMASRTLIFFGLLIIAAVSVLQVSSLKCSTPTGVKECLATEPFCMTTLVQKAGYFESDISIKNECASYCIDSIKLINQTITTIRCCTEDLCNIVTTKPTVTTTPAVATTPTNNFSLPQFNIILSIITNIICP